MFGKRTEHKTSLLQQLLTGLDALGASRYGLPGVDGRTATVSFNQGVRALQAVARHLAAHGITAASGHFYAFELMMNGLGLEGGGAVCLSILYYNRPEDVESTLSALAGLA